MSTTAERSVHKSVDVRVPVERAWTVFTERMATWWPLATHSIHAGEDGGVPDGIVIEGHVGGAIYETIGTDRRHWGTVVEWSPPTQLAVDWTVGSEVTTRWSATFTATSDGTHVDLVHDGFEAHGARAEELRSSYGAEDGWALVLRHFAEVADAGS